MKGETNLFASNGAASRARGLLTRNNTLDRFPPRQGVFRHVGSRFFAASRPIFSFRMGLVREQVRAGYLTTTTLVDRFPATARCVFRHVGSRFVATSRPFFSALQLLRELPGRR